MVRIVLAGNVPSKKNSKRIIYVHGRIMIIPSKDYVNWQKEKVLELKQQKIPRVENVKLVEITLFVPTKRRADLTNKAESIMDLLVDGDVLEDDNYFIVPELSLKLGGIDKTNPRAEVIIYE